MRHPPPFPHLLVCGLICLAWAPAQAQSPIWTEGAQPPNELPLKTESFSKLAGRVSSAVVNIIVVVAPEWVEDVDSFDLRKGAQAFGSGVIIHKDGYVITNNHVVENAVSIKVKLEDSREFSAEMVGRDPRTDIALLKIRQKEDAQLFPFVPLGNSDGLRVGELVVAIGNPLGLNHTVTTGIISALGRTQLQSAMSATRSEFIQTDASINPGNSGGPLLNLSGEVIGINTAIHAQGQGIGFAIPVNTVKALLPHLQRDGYVLRTFIGARFQVMTPILAKSFGLPSPQGVLITQILPGTPAALGGLEHGDIILEFAGHPVRDNDQLELLVSTAGADTPVALKLFRQGKELTKTLTLQPIPKQKKPRLRTRTEITRDIDASIKDLGLTVGDLDAELSRTLADLDKGVVIKAVDEKSLSSLHGLQKRDIITEVNGSHIKTPDEFYNQVESFKKGALIRLRIIRGLERKYIVFER